MIEILNLKNKNVIVCRDIIQTCSYPNITLFNSLYKIPLHDLDSNLKSQENET